MIRTSSLVIGVTVIQCASADIVKIEHIPEENEHCFIYDYNDQTKKLLRFQIKIREKTICKNDGNLTFDIRLKNIEKIDDAANIGNIKLVKGIQQVSIVPSKTGGQRSESISITIPRDQLANHPFSWQERGISVRINDQEIAKIRPLRFTITPQLSISIPENESRASLGKIIYDNGVCRSSEKHTFHLQYECLTTAKVNISSKHDFRMKLKGGEDYIPYRLKLNGGLITEQCQKEIPSTPNAFFNEITGTCKVKAQLAQIPLAGIYKDTVTFTISPD